MKTSNSESLKLVLNLGSGSVDFSRYINNGITVHVDRSYKNGNNCATIAETEKTYLDVAKGQNISTQVFCGADIFEFTENFKFKFTEIIAERIFEHLEYVSGEIGRLLEALNKISTEDAVLKIVVPNAILLSDLLVKYEKTSPDHIESLNSKLIINTEFCNIKADPHASIWTPKLAKEYIESEGTWKLVEFLNSVEFMGRNIYMSLVCRKPAWLKNNKE
jgi:hypothetical protein